jgi:hypothetical protein
VATSPAKPAGRLETFVAPRPSPALIRALIPVNRIVCLGGIPGLRAVPFLRRLPPFRGLTDIVRLELPAADEARMKAAVRPDTAAFITPNHPEFFTDWMLDKEMLARAAPMAACWATHSVVNGLGAVAQKFWLANNLIAQIPGPAGAEAREHSIAWAMKGHGVLLHPEGQVGWHGDRVATLFPGAVEMAAEAAGRAEANGSVRQALVVPVVWKLKLVGNAEAGLAREMSYLERRLGLDKPSLHATLPDRLYAVSVALLARDEARWGLAGSSGQTFKARQARLIEALTDRLVERIGAVNSNSSEAARDLLRAGDRWLRNANKDTAEHAEVRRLLRDIRLQMRFSAGVYPHPELTQEQIAESIKRLRNDYCEGTLRDTINKLVPQPAGPRVAHIRVPEPIEVPVGLAPGDAALDKLVAELQSRMQASLDAINAMLDREAGFIRYTNPFHAAG